MTTLDRQRLDDLVRHVGARHAAALLGRIPRSLDGQCAELGAAREPASARLLAHRLKGLAATSGLPMVADTAARIEIAAVAGQSWSTDALLAAVAEGVGELRRYLVEIRNGAEITDPEAARRH